MVLAPPSEGLLKNQIQTLTLTLIQIHQLIRRREIYLETQANPDAEVIALSPKSLMATNRFICEICNKGFQRDQNLQLHRRGHNLPWKLRQRSNKDVIRKKVYVCPEKSCVHHDPSRALGDLTGIKKHFSRKHGEKKWKCEKCSKKYAVQSDWKAHTKICGTREYKCDCGTLFSRKDSFITHRAFCDALAEENARFGTTAVPNTNILPSFINNNINNPQTAASRMTHPHLSPIFQPEFGSESVANFGSNATGDIRPRLPLWLDPSNSHQLNSNNIPFLSVTGGNSPSVSGGFPELLQTAAATATLFGGQPSPTPPQTSHHQWLNKFSSAHDHQGATTFPTISSSLLPRTGLKEEETKGNNNSNSISLSESMMATTSSLHPNNQSLQSQGPAPHMSATALLQKAAQMGSTRSNNASSFSGSAFGLISSLSSSSSNSRKQVLFRQPVNHQSTAAENNFNDLVNSLQAASSDNANNNNNNNNNGPAAVLSSPSSFNLKQAAAAQSLSANNNENHDIDEHSLTRDFLGVGGDGHHIHGSGSNFFQQELEKFASMGSAMNLSQFSGHH
ncbi:TFIIH C1-like domain containing protein [Parasponia andersonii]|uniref:TFIIH C1-like domain containing protein n=1 Tax=Parasponia andersonii TaxID=3476 RepID=A0A2P5BYT5_PARAD|nr:TFIIH C1-like domain containing protein [Parasponia andersonii]